MNACIPTRPQERSVVVHYQGRRKPRRIVRIRDDFIQGQCSRFDTNDIVRGFVYLIVGLVSSCAHQIVSIDEWLPLLTPILQDGDMGLLCTSARCEYAGPVAGALLVDYDTLRALLLHDSFHALPSP